MRQTQRKNISQDPPKMLTSSRIGLKSPLPSSLSSRSRTLPRQSQTVSDIDQANSKLSDIAQAESKVDNIAQDYSKISDTSQAEFKVYIIANGKSKVSAIAQDNSGGTHDTKFDWQAW